MQRLYLKTLHTVHLFQSLPPTVSGKLTGKCSCERHRICKDNIQMDQRELFCEDGPTNPVYLTFFINVQVMEHQKVGLPEHDELKDVIRSRSAWKD
jgi:hypothetical protein